MSRREPDGGPAELPTVVAHVCVTPRWVSRTILTLALVLLAALVAIGFGAVYVYQANQYVQGRGEYRDRETARTNQRINDAICDLLDQLPQGGLLERPRGKYHCGPGLPASSSRPGLSRQGNGRSAPTAAATSPSGAPQRSAAGPATSTGTAQPAPTPVHPHPPRTSTPPRPPAPATGSPLVDPDPVTHTICDALGVCI